MTHPVIAGRDAAEYTEAADNTTPIDVLEPTTDHHAKLMQEITAGIVCMLIDSRNPRVRIVAIAIAFNLPSAEGHSLKVWARRCKVSKQRLNKEVVAMRAKYRLPALGGAWTEQSRAGYRGKCQTRPPKESLESH